MPRHVPALSALLDDLGHPAPRVWARALDISERTAWRWQATDDAPRTARLALYWVTSIGWSEHQAEGLFALNTTRQLCEAYRRQIAALQAQLAIVQRLSDCGSANDPVTVPGHTAAERRNSQAFESASACAVSAHSLAPPGPGRQSYRGTGSYATPP